MRKSPMAVLMICLSLTLTACSLPARDAAADTTAVTTTVMTETPTTTVTTTQAPSATKKKSTTTKKKTPTTTKKATTTTKKATTTAKSSHTHSYVNYVCTGCGGIDKAHSFEYLSNWLTENGEVQGDHAKVSFNPKANDPSVDCEIGIQYYPESMDSDETIAVVYYEHEYQSDVYFHTMLFLYKDDTECYYISQGGFYDVEEYHLDGSFSKAKHTTKRPISYSYDTCVLAHPYATVNDMVGGVRIDINNTLIGVGELLKQRKVGITLADLGFTSF